MIEKLTLEEKEKIEFYKSKWLQIMLSTSEISKSSAIAAIDLASDLIGYEKPRIIFCDSPYAAFEKIIGKDLYILFNKAVEYNLIEKIWHHIEEQVSQEVIQLINQDTIEIETLINGYKRKIFHKIRSQLDDRTNEAQKRLLVRCNINVTPGYLANFAVKSDFCISVLKCDYNLKMWQVFQSLIYNSGWIITLERVIANKQKLRADYEKIVFITEKPVNLSLDSEYCLHSNNGEPAIQFKDGYNLHFAHGNIQHFLQTKDD